MREYFTYGSVRGAAGNGGPYRDPSPGLRNVLLTVDVAEGDRGAAPFKRIH
jgi:hypothetical protein